MKIFKKIRLETEFNIVFAAFLLVMLIAQVVLIIFIENNIREQRNMSSEIISSQINTYISGKIETMSRIKNEVRVELIVPSVLEQDNSKVRYEAIERYAQKLEEVQNYCPDTFYMILQDKNGNFEKLTHGITEPEYELLCKEISSEDNVDSEIYFLALDGKAYSDFRYIYTSLPVMGFDQKLYKTVDYGKVGICIKIDVREVFSADRFSNQYENINLSINVNGTDVNLIRSYGNDSHLINIDGGYITNTNWEITGYVYDYTHNMLAGMRILVYLGIMLMLVMIVIFRKVIVKEIIKPISNIRGYLTKHGLNDKNEALVIDGNKDINELADAINKLYEEMRADAHKIFKNQQALYEKDILSVETQLRLLQNQVNPHFIYNTFETIRALASIYEAKEIQVIISALNKLLRYNLNSAGKTRVCEEVEIINKYIEIMQIRYEDAFSFKYECEEEAEDEAVLKMMCQPLIENCFSHGFKSDGSKLNINMKIRVSGDKVIVTISDDGKGIPPDKRTEILKSIDGYHGGSQGIGLSNLVYRLRLCYDNNFDFQILSEENEYTIISVTVPREG